MSVRQKMALVYIVAVSGAMMVGFYYFDGAPPVWYSYSVGAASVPFLVAIFNKRD